MIFGIGTDITEISRIEEMIERHGEHFLTRIYTPGEIEYCGRHKLASQHFAGRWAAKEAILKCFGTGFTKGIGWLDIEVVSQKTGRPLVELSGGAARLAGELEISEVLVTISHCQAYATATAIALMEA